MNRTFWCGIARAIGQREFVERDGDEGEEELLPQGGTIPQRLLLMNGDLVRRKNEGQPAGQRGVENRHARAG